MTGMCYYRQLKKMKGLYDLQLMMSQSQTKPPNHRIKCIIRKYSFKPFGLQMLMQSMSFH